MKELLIILYRLNIKGLTYEQADKYATSTAKTFSLREDEELKDNYTIREIFIPILEGDTDVKVIYPIPKYTTSPEINELVSEISNKIKEDPSNTLKLHWERLVRELKLRKISNE